MPKTVDNLSPSTLFWLVIIAAFVAAELGVTLMLVRLSANPTRGRY
jgi:hypothetical protein